MNSSIREDDDDDDDGDGDGDGDGSSGSLRDAKAICEKRRCESEDGAAQPRLHMALIVSF